MVGVVQAKRWAKRYDTKVVSVYDVRLDTSLNIKDFKEMSEEWLDFIVACRHGEPHDYNSSVYYENPVYWIDNSKL